MKKTIVSAAAKSKRGRSSDEPSCSKFRKTFDQEMCVFCQQTSKKIAHSVSSPDKGQKILDKKERTTCVLGLLNPKNSFA